MRRSGRYTHTMLDFTPDPIAFQIGPLPVYWYGIGYALGLAAVYLLLTWLAKRAGEDPELVGNGMIVVAVAALIGGRAYHVIDQWALYKDDLSSIVLPPYSGLGVYGGIVTGFIAVVAYTRYHGVPFWRWADIAAPGLFLMQGVARWGNFFNQELYGSPTDLPWGIVISCIHRIPAYPCSTFPFETTTFHPLFLYESFSGLLGVAALVALGFALRSRLRPGDLLMVFFVWYGVVRFALEGFRHDNWTFFSIPTAQIVSIAFIAVGLIVLIARHRPGRRLDPPATRWGIATWGALGEIPDEPWVPEETAVDDQSDSFEDLPEFEDLPADEEPRPTS